MMRTNSIKEEQVFEMLKNAKILDVRRSENDGVIIVTDKGTLEIYAYVYDTLFDDYYYHRVDVSFDPRTER